jgi:hypothetical protein
MLTKSPPLLLRVPSPSKHSLSYCDVTPAALAHWLSELPKANIGETARQLYQGLMELNQLHASSDVRLRLLELFRPEVYAICKSLERYFLSQAIILDERPRKVANLCQALQTHLASGYKLVVSDELKAPSRNMAKLLPFALQRACHSLRQPLLRACQLYCPMPEGLWLELHQLYQIACQYQLQAILVRDELARGLPSPAMTVQQAYIAALLLGCAQTNQMRQNEVAQLAEVLDNWSALVRLQAAEHPFSLFVAMPGIDAAPRYRSLHKPEELPGALGIDPQRLTDAIRQYLLLANEPGADRGPLWAPDGFKLELLQHLEGAWSEIAERTFPRNPGQGELHLSIGMSAAHYHLAGRRLFQDLLKHQDNAGAARFTQQQIPDVWANAFDAQPINWDGGLAYSEVINYSGGKASPDPSSAEQTEADENYPTYSLPVINASPGGYCLSWPGEVPAKLQAGELLAIREDGQSSWSVAAVRWIRQVRNGGTQMGIELISPVAQPCGLKLLRKGDASSQYLRALLLPAIEAISRPSSLITPRLPFQEGNKVLLNLNGDENRAILGQRHAQTASFNHFEFRSLEENRPQSSASSLSKGGNSSGDEDFDSLWNSL